VAYARALLPHVDRKLVKQTVMTSVYGVTFIGARQQIQNRLKERDLFDEDFRYKVACYAARETLKSLDTMFSNAREVMAWLGEAASLVAELGDEGRGDSVRWRTPLGLPVVQPYRKRGRKIVRTLMQNFIVEYDNDLLPVLKQKQRSAFPPNYIHSVDSAHMMLTAIACNKVGLSFAGVHDSYWTHAG
jgi:DNA-directed RNA polymerase